MNNTIGKLEALSPELQIEILEKAKTHYKKDRRDSVCESISLIISEYVTDNLYTHENREKLLAALIPQFSFEGVTELARKYKFKKPLFSTKGGALYYSGYWWEIGKLGAEWDHRSRQACFNALIKELKLKV